MGYQYKGRPVLSLAMGGIPIEITFDTGSARTLIDSKLIRDNTKICGQIPIRGAHGDVQI